MLSVQLDLFKSYEQAEIDTLRIALQEVKTSSDKVRRGTYAKINELNRECTELKSRLDIMERYVCKGEK